MEGEEITTKLKECWRAMKAQASDEPPTHPSKVYYCATCETWLNGDDHWLDHSIGRKHKRHLKREHGKHSVGSKRKSEGLVIPKGTAIIIEQTAIYNDAVSRYVLSLYDRALLRSRL